MFSILRKYCFIVELWYKNTQVGQWNKYMVQNQQREFYKFCMWQNWHFKPVEPIGILFTILSVFFFKKESSSLYIALIS